MRFELTQSDTINPELSDTCRLQCGILLVYLSLAELIMNIYSESTLRPVGPTLICSPTSSKPRRYQRRQ
jgi:hypothetical protein